MNGTIAGVVVALVAALAAIGLLSEDEQPDEPSARTAAGPPVERVARRIERVRELRFERLPRVKRVSSAQARRAGLGELDRQSPRRELEAEERLLKLLGLIPPEARLRDLLAEMLAGEVGGYYLPRTRTLSIVGDPGGLLGEVTLAHELTHALEDQHFGIEPAGSIGFRRDRSIADAAVREGTATVAMVDYLILKQGGGADVPAGLRGRALKQIEGVALPASSGLPRYMREGLVFPYAAGGRLVNRIEGRGGWKAVNRAFGRDAPVSSEQVMHAAKYNARERPLRVRLRGLAAALPAGAERLAQGGLGEFDTEQLLRSANGRRRSASAAAGWGGDAFALWRLPGGSCEEPCRESHVLAIRWVWDTARDARQFERAARRTVRRLGGGASVRRRGRSVAVVLAPRGAAAALARLALPGRPR